MFTEILDYLKDKIDSAFNNTEVDVSKREESLIEKRLHKLSSNIFDCTFRKRDDNFIISRDIKSDDTYCSQINSVVFNSMQGMVNFVLTETDWYAKFDRYIGTSYKFEYSKNGNLLFTISITSNHGYSVFTYDNIISSMDVDLALFEIEQYVQTIMSQPKENKPTNISDDSIWK